MEKMHLLLNREHKLLIKEAKQVYFEEVEAKAIIQRLQTDFVKIENETATFWILQKDVVGEASKDQWQSLFEISNADFLDPAQKTKIIEAYFDIILQQRIDLNEKFDVWAFGGGGQLAEDLLALVLEGKKTGTCGMLWDYEFYNDPIPQVGSQQLVVDSKGRPGCLIELTKVEIVPFNEVTPEFARTEGEGDLSYEYWKKAHLDFFTKNAPSINCEVTEDMPLVCENFKVIRKYQESHES